MPDEVYAHWKARVGEEPTEPVPHNTQTTVTVKYHYKPDE